MSYYYFMVSFRSIVIVSSMVMMSLVSSIASAQTVDMWRVQQQRITRINTERATLGRSPYVLDVRLNETAQNWANYLRDKNITNPRRIHQRTPSDGYYHYNNILNRFKKQGVRFEGRGTAYTEIVGRWVVRCRQQECTDELIAATKSTRQFFMKEKYRKSRWPHYKAIVSQKFDRMGISVAVDRKTGRYWMVGHGSVKIAPSK